MRQLLVLLVLVSTTGLAQSRLTRHYKKMLEDPIVLKNKIAANQFVTINFVEGGDAKLVIVKKPKPLQRSLFSLDTGVQREYIKAYLEEAKEDKFNKKSISDILCYSCKTNVVSSSTPLVIDRTKFTKAFEFDVSDVFDISSKRGRITELLITLTLDDNSEIEFASFVNLSTKYETVDFGNIGLTRNRNFTLNAGFELAGTGSTAITTGTSGSVTDTLDGNRIITSGTSDTSVNNSSSSNKSNLGATFGSSRTVAEERKISERRIGLKGTITGNSLTLYQQGAPNMNLNDKVQVEVILIAKNVVPQKVFKMGQLMKKGRPILNNDSLSISYHYINMPKLGTSNDVQGKLSYRFGYRKVVGKSSRSSNEAEHIVQFYNLIDPSYVETAEVILNTQEFKPRVYSLIKNPSAAGPRVWINYYNLKGEILRFMSIPEADTFFSYLVAVYSPAPGDPVIKYKGMSLYLSGNSNLSGKELKKSDLKDLEISYL